MNDIILKFKDYLKKKQRSESTIQAYNKDVEGFLIFLKGLEISYLYVSEDNINEYAQALKKDGKANSTISRNLIAIRCFYKFLLSENKLDKTPMYSIESPKHNRPIPVTLTIKEVDNS